jgi:hypothetical protein
VKPGKFPNAFHWPIGSASIDFQPFFDSGIQDQIDGELGSIKERVLAGVAMIVLGRFHVLTCGLLDLLGLRCALLADVKGELVEKAFRRAFS